MSDIIISKGTRKRIITTPFTICGNFKTLRRMAKQILVQTEDEEIYGWVDIYGVERPGLITGPPMNWEE